MIFEPKKIKSDTVSTVSPSISRGVVELDAMIVSLGRFISKYSILFIAMVNGIVSLISLSVSHC